jgi:hypothetical protein
MWIGARRYELFKCERPFLQGSADEGTEYSHVLQVNPDRPFGRPATRYMLSISGTFRVDTSNKAWMQSI